MRYIPSHREKVIHRFLCRLHLRLEPVRQGIEQYGERKPSSQAMEPRRKREETHSWMERGRTLIAYKIEEGADKGRKKKVVLNLSGGSVRMGR